MKTIGLLGGMSWESSVTYYQIVNQMVKERLGGLHSAKVILFSVDFAQIEKFQAEGDWEKSATVLSAAAQSLERAGADIIAICTNTMHKVYPQVQQSVNIPVLHIAEATARKLTERGIKKVALLGTKYTMTQDFYKDKIIEAGIQVLVPQEKDLEMVNRVIYGELCQGLISLESKKEYFRVIKGLEKQGAEGVILGCTEIGLLIGQKDLDLPVFDTARIHAEQAALYALGEDKGNL